MIARFERQVEESGILKPSEQDGLRQLLQIKNDQSKAMRDRLIALLNPANAPIIHLTESELQNVYKLVTTNNYQRLPDRGSIIGRISFDANHGYYVMLDFEPL